MEDLAVNIHDKLLVSLRRIIRAVDVHSRQLVHKQHLTVPQLLCLKAVGSCDELSVSGIAKRVGLSNATVSGIVDRLEHRGLIERRRGVTDRRQSLLSIATEGREALERAPTLLQESFVPAFDALSVDEQQRLLQALERIATLMGVENLDAAPLLASHPMTVSDEALLPESIPEALPPAGKKSSSAKTAGAEITIHHVASGLELPSWLSLDDLVRFLHAEMQPYHDQPDDIRRGVLNALSGCPAAGGFVLVAERDAQILGSLVMIGTGMQGYAPEHMLLFVGVHHDCRGEGLGGKLIRRALELTPGDVKLHVEKDNPARRLYERLGFKDKYAEMRYSR